jgi:hypothetical protein
MYKGVSKSFRTGRLERELQMIQLSATRCSCIAILSASLVSFAVTTLCVASQRVIPKVSVNFVIDSGRKLLDTPSYTPSRGGKDDKFILCASGSSEYSARKSVSMKQLSFKLVSLTKFGLRALHIRPWTIFFWITQAQI